MTEDTEPVRMNAGRMKELLDRRGIQLVDDDEIEDPMSEWQSRRRAEMVDRLERTIPRKFAAASWESVEAGLRSELTLPLRRSVVLSGPVGRGKTWAMWALMREEARRGRSCRVVRWPELLDELRPGGDERPAQLLAGLGRVDVLGIDELGSGSVTDWAMGQLETLVDVRWREDRPIVATTNLDVARDGALAAEVGPRVASRLFGDGTLRYVVQGQDRRRS